MFNIKWYWFSTFGEYQSEYTSNLPDLPYLRWFTGINVLFGQIHRNISNSWEKIVGAGKFTPFFWRKQMSRINPWCAWFPWERFVKKSPRNEKSSGHGSEEDRMSWVSLLPSRKIRLKAWGTVET